MIDDSPRGSAIDAADQLGVLRAVGGVDQTSGGAPNDIRIAETAEMTAGAKANEVRLERARELKYREQLRDDALHPPQPEGPRNGLWTGTSIRPSRPVPNDLLVGRVALRTPDVELGGITEFYVGYAHARIDGIAVYGWRNSFCRSFFDPAERNGSDFNAAGFRTFFRSERIIDDFVDDIVCGDPPEPLFGRPALPVHEEVHQRTTTSSARSPNRVPDPAATQSGGAGSSTSNRVPIPNRGQRDPDGGEARAFVRAERLLHRVLRAPRTKELGPVLATLQPEQYRLITASPDDNMIVEGGPGTGKTIIASHRAAYLISDARPPAKGLGGDVLLVGPTPNYIRHIDDVIKQLTGGSPRIKLIALPDLDKLASGIERPLAGLPTQTNRNTLSSLDRLAKRARAQLTNGRDTDLTVAQVYAYLQSNGTPQRPLTREPRWVEYFRALPPHVQAMSTHRGLIELIQHGLTPDSSAPPIRHVIVDEAQDVTPAEWLKLSLLNESGGWTILGDLNQRRADHTFRSWPAVLKAVGLHPGTMSVGMRQGYRSTTPILRYANRLLSRHAHPPVALQGDGPDPKIVPTIREHLIGRVVREVDQLLLTYASGTIAVITTMPGPIAERLQPDSAHANVTVLGPNQSRGLEFDAVVVVEPSDFPRNDRRYGPLYTALTRPNRELVVVHSKALPAPLLSEQRTAVRPWRPEPPTRSAELRVAAKTTKKTLKRRKPRRSGEPERKSGG